jgi:ABC-type Zn uptake system ZnuABC Zn-binding protein ZnuA
VGGDRVRVSHLVPPALDAESFQPRPQDVARLGDAQVVVRAGVDYDVWLDRLLAQSPNAALRRGGSGYVDASAYVALLDVRAGGITDEGHPHGRGNPHYWLDPANAEMITAAIAEGFARADPGNARRYEANRIAYLERIGKRMHDWQEALRPFQGTALIAYHDTWPYFARRFRLHFVGAIEARPGVPPSASGLAALAKAGAEQHVAAIVREPHEPARDAEFLAAKTGARVCVLASSVGEVPEASDYIGLIDYDVATLRKALARD